MKNRRMRLAVFGVLALFAGGVLVTRLHAQPTGTGRVALVLCAANFSVPDGPGAFVQTYDASPGSPAIAPWPAKSSCAASLAMLIEDGFFIVEIGAMDPQWSSYVLADSKDAFLKK